MRITINPVADAASFYDAAAEDQQADDARAENARRLESLAWTEIQYGGARSYANDLGDVLSQSDDVLERLIANVAGMRKGDQLRGWYAEAIARDVEALVSKAVADVAFAAALEQTA